MINGVNAGHGFPHILRIPQVAVDRFDAAVCIELARAAGVGGIDEAADAVAGIQAGA